MVRPNRKPLGGPGINEQDFNLNRSIEHLAELQGRDGSLKYRQMATGDPTVGMLLRVHKNPIRSANWGIPLPNDVTPIEEKAINMLNKWLFEDYTLTFDTLLGQILSFLEYGFSLFERVYVPYVFDGEKLLAPTLQQRIQTSILNIFPDRQIIQQMTFKAGLVDIPMEDLIFFTLNQQGWDLRGESLLRTSYKSYKSKSVYNEYMGIGIQRTTAGIPTMIVPKGTKPDGADYLAAEVLLKSIAFHEDAYMILPAGWDFSIEAVGFDSEKVQKAIDSLDTKMALSVLAQFVLLGQQGKGGAYALSRDQSDFFLDGLQYIVTLIEKIFHRQVLTPTVRMNFGENIDMSRIKLRGMNLNKKAGVELSEVLKNLVEGKFISSTIEDEIQLRSYLEMPALSEEDVEKRKTREDKPDPIPPTIPVPEKKNTGEDDPEEKEGGKVKPDDNTKNILKFTETNIQERKALLDRTIKEVKDFMQANLLLIKDKMLADIRNTLNRGKVEIRGLKMIEISSTKYRKSLERKLAGIANEGWNTAKKKAKTNNVKFAEDMDPLKLADKELSQYILNESQSIVDSQTENMKNKAILTASNGPVKGFSVNQTMANVEKVVDDFIKSNSVSVGSNLVVVGSNNFGANEFNKTIENQLWGYVFSAIDDGVTTDICKFYNGKTYSVNSTELSIVTPPLHPNALINGSKILTDEGEVNIEDIKIGDKVLTHENRYKEVYSVMSRFEDKHYYEIELDNGKKINITAEHPILINRKNLLMWIRADQINLSDNIVCLEDIQNA